MKIAFITNLRAPYRTIQLNEFSKIDGISINVFYIKNNSENRKWNTGTKKKFKEYDLEGYKIFNCININKNLSKIIKKHDFLVIGGYDQPAYIFLSLLCKLFKKKYILLFDGISTNRIGEKDITLKYFIKKFVIKNATYIFGNGDVSIKYFSENFKYDKKKIINQYLTVDKEMLDCLYSNKEFLRGKYREKLGIEETQKVVLYSGRLIDIKNVDVLIRALSIMDNKSKIVLLITGGGKLEKDLINLAKDLDINVIITGFIESQQELFKHYFAADLLVLPSLEEPWGLVVNEAMCAGLPVVVSNICGCSYDLVKNGENGYLINPNDIYDISQKINLILEKNNSNNIFGIKSRNIIRNWTFNNSKVNFEKIVNEFKKGEGIQ